MKAREFDLEDILINFSSGGGNTPFTVRQAAEGVVVFGSNGSGKSSGSLKTFLLRYMGYGMGGLILTAKPGEKETVLEYLKQTKRLQDLIVVEPGGQYQFDFLAYEASQKVDGKAISDNLAHLIETVIDSDQQGHRAQSSEPFWTEARHQLIVSVIDLSLLAYNTTSVRGLYDIAITIPQRGQKEDEKPKPHSFAHAFQSARVNVEKQIQNFVATLPEAEKQKLSDDNYFDHLVVTQLPDAALFRSFEQFFDQFKNLAEKTRGIVMMTFTNFLFQLLREPIYSLFCRHTNFTPEDCLNGKIILLNVPTKLYHKAGRDIQVAFKYIWQRAMERRNIAENARPVFLIADEAQEFLHTHDVAYQATARGQKICTLYVTQNLSSFYAKMGGIQSEHLVNSFLGTLGIKIFHSNSDVQTNKYASELIGSAYTVDESSGVTMGENVSSSRNKTYKLEAMMRPEAFTRLLAGGPRNNYLVEGVVHLQNTQFHDGHSFRKIIFKQN